MADNFTYKNGTGTVETGLADEVTDGTLGVGKVTYVKLMDGALNGTNKAGVGANGLAVDGSAVIQPVSGTFWQAIQPVSAASLPLPTGAATAAKQPALGTAGTASADVITVQGVASGVGLTTQLAESSNIVSGAITTAMTGTTSTSLVAAPGASLRNYLTTIVVSNSHATVGTDVVIQDGSSGTTLMTIPAAALYGGAVISLNPPLRQPTTNTAIFCANVTTGASTKVSANGFKGA